MTADHYPHVHEPGPGALVYLGCNGRGVALATAMGQQLAKRLIGGETVAIDMPITSLRPIRFHALWSVAVKSVVLYGRIRDRLGLSIASDYSVSICILGGGPSGKVRPVQSGGGGGNDATAHSQ